MAILLSNYQKSCFICLSSALVSQSINICTYVMYTGVFQKPQLYIHDSGHDTRFERDGKIEVHWD